MTINFQKIDIAKVQEGEGFWVKRPFPTSSHREIDPFLLFDHFGPTHHKPGEALGTPVHPHKGFELITYMLHGDMHHQDSLGNDALAREGGAQWFYAGSGVLHKEIPSKIMRDEGGLLEGIQLWINLKRESKKRAPFYRNLKPDDFPNVETEAARIKVIAGHFEDARSPIQTDSPTQYIDLQFTTDMSESLSNNENEVTLIYGLRQSAIFESGDIRNELKEGEMIAVSGKGTFGLSSNSRARLLILKSAALNEPIARGGPFVMNERHELVQAFEEAQSGKFGSLV